MVTAITDQSCGLFLLEEHCWKLIVKKYIRYENQVDSFDLNNIISCWCLVPKCSVLRKFYPYAQNNVISS